MDEPLGLDQAFVRSAEQLNWRPMSPGIEVASILKDRSREFSVMLLRFAPGAAAPLHVHEGGEQYYLLEGDLEDGGRLLAPGSFVNHPPGSRHAPRSPSGCLVYVTWFGRIRPPA